KNGRPGPVWLDVPLDVQAAVIETEELAAYDQSEDEERENPSYDPALTEQILDKVREAKRPVILGGTAIRQSG
ncbi:MAG: thiamine pyrophosphate-binding protein, partial [Firmicutes bacterium]|nr:thiamine pyrophosphate-binding protein [Bacillota bacterium]